MCEEDDVVDYLIMEAVSVKVRQEEREREKSQEKANWKKDRKGSELSKYAG